MKHALVNNYSYKEYCQLEESRIPSLLERHQETLSSEVVEEDLEWMTLTEKDMERMLMNEEGNIREEDIDMIISRSGVLYELIV